MSRRWRPPLARSSARVRVHVIPVNSPHPHPHSQTGSTNPSQTACCFVSVDGAVATTPLLLGDLLNGLRSSYVSYSESEQLFSFDHVYRSKGGT